MSPVIRHANGEREVYATEPPRGTPSGPARLVSRATVWARSVPAHQPYLRRAEPGPTSTSRWAGVPRAERLRAGREELAAQRRSRLTARQAKVIEAVRRTGSRKAARDELGICSLQAVTSSLLEALAKGLLPADLPDLPPRILRRLPVPVQAST